MPALKITGKKGHTIAEVLVSLASFLVLTTVIAGALTIAVNYLKMTEESIQAKRLIRNCMDIITADINEAIPNPDPGLTNPPTGYLSIEPPPPPGGSMEAEVLSALKRKKTQKPTAFLLPNINMITSNQLVFNKPDFDKFNPLDENFVLDKPENYKVIRYYIESDTLHREEKTINADGTYSSPDIIPIAGIDNGKMSISAKFVDLRTIHLTINVTLTGTSEKKYKDTAVLTVMASDR
jgi:type II secretory pathway pseudopilin PulG